MWPAHYLELGPHEMVPVFPREYVKIVVVGRRDKSLYTGLADVQTFIGGDR